MDAVISELPLALFTTLAPIGATSFIVVALAFFLHKESEFDLARIDRLTLAPLAFVLVGFVAAFFHLASPLNAFGVLSGLVRSPLSNEVLAGLVFFIAALVYWILAVTGKLSFSSRKIFVAFVALLAIVFSCLTGAAYMMESIPSWNTVLAPIETVSVSILGGSVLGYAVVRPGVSQKASRTFELATFGVGLLGFAVAATSLVGYFEFFGSLWSPAVEGASLAATAVPFAWGFVGCALASLACLGYAIASSHTTVPSIAAVCLGTLSVFLARIVFYAMQMPIGM